MKNKTTYEMEDIMGLITKDLADKGLAPDPRTVEIRAAVADTEVKPTWIEIDVNVSWVGIPSQDDDASAQRVRARRALELGADVQPPRQDLLDEAPSPRGRPTVVLGDVGEPSDTVEDVTAASTRIIRSGGSGPFAPERVKRRLLDDESTEWPGNSPARGR